MAAGLKAGILAAGRTLARRTGLLEPHPGYDVQLYAAIAALRRWRPDDAVVDVGANDGRTVLRLDRHLPRPRIHALEPVGTTFATLVERTRNLPHVRPFRLALGSAPGRPTIYLHENAAVNSLDPGWGSCTGHETVEMTTLDLFATAQGLDRIALLKVDAEGHDLEVLKGAARLLERRAVDLVMVEAGFGAPGKPQPQLQEFQAWLAPYGVHLYGIYNQCRARRTQADNGASPPPDILVYCDALFVKA